MSTYKIKKNKIVEFVNFYEPLWYELCDVYSLGNQNESNNILKKELTPLGLEIEIRMLKNDRYNITAIATKDNNCIVLDQIIETYPDDSIEDYLEFFEKIID